MSEELKIIIEIAVFVLFLIINSGARTKKIINSENKLLDVLKGAKESITKTITDEQKEIQTLKLSNQFILNELKQNYLERLEITNDESEKQDLLDKIKTLEKLGD